MNLSKFSISEIKENIRRCELLNENYYDLYDIYKLLTSMDNSFALSDVKMLDFYNHQQFIFNIYGVKKRIFYKTKEEIKDTKSNTIEKSFVNTDNTMIFIFNTQLVNKGRVRLNKKIRYYLF